jgi:hypothetical protein
MLLENFLFPGTGVNDSIQKLLIHFNLLLHGCLHKVTTPNFRFTHNQLYLFLFTGSVLHLQELSHLLLKAMTCLAVTIDQCNHLIDALLVRGQLAIESRFCTATPCGEIAVHLLFAIILLCQYVSKVLSGEGTNLHQYCYKESGSHADCTPKRHLWAMPSRQLQLQAAA